MNTQNLNEFGYREKTMAAELLLALADNKFADSRTMHLDNELRIEFNPSSGNVFFVDEDYNVAMLNDEGMLEMFVSCGNCGQEGFLSDDVFPRGEFLGLCTECKKIEDEKEKQNS